MIYSVRDGDRGVMLRGVSRVFRAVAHGMPLSLRAQVLIRHQYYDRCNNMLSPALRSEVAHHLHGYMLDGVHFFSCDEPKERERFTVAVARHLKMAVYGKGEPIVAGGKAEMARHLGFARE